jgi:type IV secretory pathway TraG/TraD family ATPase VirD4
MNRPDYQFSDQPETSPQPFLANERGWVIGRMGEDLLRFETDKHMVSIANTGGGKGTSVAISNLLLHQGSLISVEIGGATYRATHRTRRFGMGQEVHVIDPYGATDEGSSTLNLLDTLDPTAPGFFNEVKLFAGSILKNERGTSSSDRYWEDVPRQGLMGFLIYTRCAPTLSEHERNLPHMAKLISNYGGDGWAPLMQQFSEYMPSARPQNSAPRKWRRIIMRL